jgi:hypothetical protein
MDNEKRDEQEQKLPYEPPAVVTEEVFETLAVACGKQGTSKCILNGGNNS